VRDDPVKAALSGVAAAPLVGANGVHYTVVAAP
jgi:hypothetical protein